MQRSKQGSSPTRLAICSGLTFLICLCASAVDAQTAAKTKAGVVGVAPPNASVQKATVPLAAPVAVSGTLAAGSSRAPASLDPNRAVEVRGQSRTLSMMLVLKNGKDNINFIRVRKDYKDEIHATEF